MGFDLPQSMKDGIANSTIFLCCIDELYQTRPNCLLELDEAVRLKKTIVTIPLDSNFFVWSTADIRLKCQILTKMFIDISKITSNSPNNLDDNGKNWYIPNTDPTSDMIEILRKDLDKPSGLFQILATLLKSK